MFSFSVLSLLVAALGQEPVWQDSVLEEVCDGDSSSHLSLLQLRASKVAEGAEQLETAVFEYTEGQIDNAEYTGSPTYDTEDLVTEACTAQSRCKGIWLQAGTNLWRMLFAGGRSWARGVPNGSVVSVKVKPVFEYTEGQIDNAEYTGSPTYATEDLATEACTSQDRCKGIWLQAGTNLWRMLFAGGRSWASGVPNGSVVSVKVKGLPAPAVDVLAPVFEYIEGQIDNAEYTGSPTYGTEDEVKEACSAQDRCKGIWLQAGTNLWRMLFAGGRSWARGVPNSTIVSVKVRSVPVEDAAAAVGDPHLTTAHGEHYDLNKADLERPHHRRR